MPERVSDSPNDLVIDYTADSVRRSIEDSLQRLGVSHLDVIFVHDLSPDFVWFPTGWEAQYKIACKGAFPARSRMREEGLIRAWGVGVNTPYAKGHDLVQTRSRAYKKNEQAWVEQKIGAIVRRLVGYGRLSGTAATKALATLYASSRLYINFFQPSFKLKSKTRDGARVHKVYFTPATPCDRLLAYSSAGPATREKLTAQFMSLDPVRLLQEIRLAQLS
jgi:aryl-alcohol dehydrogenase-like predicted oxidoreductase